VVVAVFPKMQSDSDIADYTQRVAQAWGVGQKERRNGVVLFVFIQDRKMFIQVGYGLEGALPDATAIRHTGTSHHSHLFRLVTMRAGLADGNRFYQQSDPGANTKDQWKNSVWNTPGRRARDYRHFALYRPLSLC
jgi:hypothetical protein